jgi:hypothetical protein
MRVLIRFKGDNDFGDTMRPFGELLIAGSKDWTDKWLSKENIVRWFNIVAPMLYEMIQAKHYFSGEDAKTQRYLQIDESEVFIGAEVDDKMATYHQWGNYDSVLIELGERGKEYPTPLVTVV